MVSSLVIDRRSLCIAAGASLLSAPMIMTRAEAATTGANENMNAAPLPQINQFKVGSFKFTVVKDGASVLERPYETFGTNQARETVQELLARNFLPTDKLVNTYSPVVVDTGSDVVLFDTGFGAPMRAKGAGMLLDGLKAAGYTPDRITVVALTHMHGDHIGGLMENGAPAFPNARYAAGRVEYDFWTDTARAGTPAEGGHKLVLSNVVPLADKMTFLKEGDEVVPGMAAILAPGHTPGHLVYRLESDGKTFFLTGDTANHYILSLGRPDWEVRFDMDKAQAAASRRKIFDMIAVEKNAFLGYHMPFPAVGFVEKADGGYRFVPKTYQFDL